MKNKLIGLAFATVLGIASVAGILAISTTTEARVDSTRDCDKFAIVYCGTMSLDEIRNNYNAKDHAAVFGAFGIKKADIGGSIKNGTVYQDGRVVVDGKTVATGAVMAARHLGGSSISGSSTAKKVSVSKMGSAQTAFVKFDANGKFLWAIMKPCGNPVTATPPPTPKPPVAACEKLAITPLSRTQFRLNAKAGVANGAKVSNYYFEIKNSAGKVIGNRTISTGNLTASIDTGNLAPGAYSASVKVRTSVGEKTGPQCQVRFHVAEAPVAACEKLTATKISRNVYRLDAKAGAARGATVSGYYFEIKNSAGQVIGTRNVSSKALTASIETGRLAPGTYTAAVTVKTSVGDKKGAQCVVQFTVTEEPKVPVYRCDALTVQKLSDTQFKFTTQSTVENATLIRTEYIIRDANGTQISRSENDTYTQTTPGTYSVESVLTVRVGNETVTVPVGNCKATFTVPTTPEPEEPGVSIDKKVDGVEHKPVDLNQEFTYQLVVTNTGDIDLTNVVVTDPAPTGVQFISADRGAITNNVWTFTIPELKVGESTSFAIKAKVTQEIEGRIKNTACVDAPQVPGNPDDCDDATVEVPPKPGKIVVCEIDTKTIITINENEFDASKHSTNLDDCAEVPVTPPTPETPTELPQTGAATAILSVLGLGSLTASTMYYLRSRR